MQQSKGKVLITDDHNLVRFGIAHLIGRLLPGSNGLRVIDDVQAIRAVLPIVVISGIEDAQLAHRAFFSIDADKLHQCRAQSNCRERFTEECRTGAARRARWR